MSWSSVSTKMMLGFLSLGMVPGLDNRCCSFFRGSGTGERAGDVSSGSIQGGTNGGISAGLDLGSNGVPSSSRLPPSEASPTGARSDFRAVQGSTAKRQHRVLAAACRRHHGLAITRYYRRKSGDSEPGPWISDVLTTQLSLLSEARAKEIIFVLWASANAVCSSIPLKHFIQSGKTASSQKNGNPLKQEGPVTRAAFTRTRDWLEQLGCHC